MAKTWIECFQEAKIIAGAGRQPCKSWVTGLWPDFDEGIILGGRLFDKITILGCFLKKELYWGVISYRQIA